MVHLSDGRPAQSACPEHALEMLDVVGLTWCSNLVGCRLGNVTLLPGNPGAACHYSFMKAVPADDALH